MYLRDQSSIFQLRGPCICLKDIRLETTEWIRQTEDMLHVLKDQGSNYTFFKPEYDQHYSILFSLGNPCTPLCKAMLDQMNLSLWLAAA